MIRELLWWLLTNCVYQVLYMFVPMIVHTTSAAICYYFSRVACKLCMQGFSFSLPLTIITPATAAVYCYLCDLQHVNVTLLVNQRLMI